jgi:hypothetical protein
MGEMRPNPAQEAVVRSTISRRVLAQAIANSSCL